jgi:rod shape-determining protein MreC
VYDKTVRRRRAVLALLVAGSLILLTASFGGGDGVLSSVQRGVVTVVSPIQEGASRALKPVRDLFGWVRDTVDAKGKVADLERERDAYRRQAVAGTAALRENARLQELLDLNESLTLDAYQPVAARTIGVDPSVWWSQITINRGTSDGVRVDQPVVTGKGLVGRVSFATGSTAIVTLITDHTTYVPARVNETGVDGGVAAEAGRPDDLVMQYTTRNDRVDRGQVVVTAGTRARSDGLRSLYPPNIPIGEVTRVDDPGTDDQRVHVRPFADVRRLEFVQVLTKAANANRPRQ